MIALDTNVLVRFLVSDDAAQGRAVSRLVERTVRSGQQLFISDLVLVETVWVLSRSYALPKGDIIHALRLLLAARNLRWESAERITRALAAFEAGRGGFSDYLIRQIAREHGYEKVATFDRKLLKDDGFQLP